jgi:hypothetical protein
MMPSETMGKGGLLYFNGDVNLFSLHGFLFHNYLAYNLAYSSTLEVKIHLLTKIVIPKSHRYAQRNFESPEMTTSR